MPTYEYRCTRCDHRFDQTQKVGDPAPSCPACGAATRKVFSSVGLIFKGSGFHTTDYRKPAPADSSDAKPSTEAPKTGAKESAASPPTPSTPSTPPTTKDKD